jgi:hypothetical protein
MRRWRERYEEFGYDGLYDRRKCRPSPKRVALKTAEKELELYGEKEFDFNVRHFHEKAGGSTRHRAQLHVGEAGLARCGVGEQAAAAREAPAEAAAAAVAGDVVAHRCQQACLVWGWAVLRSDHDPGRRHQRDLLRATDAGGRPADVDAGGAGSDRAAGCVLRVVQGSGQPFFS